MISDLLNPFRNDGSTKYWKTSDNFSEESPNNFEKTNVLFPNVTLASWIFGSSLLLSDLNIDEPLKFKVSRFLLLNFSKSFGTSPLASPYIC